MPILQPVVNAHRVKERKIKYDAIFVAAKKTANNTNDTNIYFIRYLFLFCPFYSRS